MVGQHVGYWILAGMAAAGGIPALYYGWLANESYQTFCPSGCFMVNVGAIAMVFGFLGLMACFALFCIGASKYEKSPKKTFKPVKPQNIVAAFPESYYEPSQTPSSTIQEKKYCPSCGATLPEHSNYPFCPECGEPI